jgi:hypothetical protein
MVYKIKKIVLILSNKIIKLSNSICLLFSVSPECSQKERRPSLSLEELRFLSQLTESFVKLENSIQELFAETLSLLQMPRSSPGTVLFS